MVPTVLLILVSVAGGCLAAKQPNIMFVVADDLGWNDVGWHNPDIISPNLDALAKSGIILDHNYVQPVCSPSRAAFFTGTYPYRMGLQHLVIQADQGVCIPLDKKMLPQVLQENGYATHMLGKWHLGFCKWECTPTYRGFDTFFGYYNGGETYYSKEIDEGYDFRDNFDVYKEGANNYSTYQYADRMESLIDKHDTEKPMFMYLAFQNVHTPFEVPDEYTAKYPNMEDGDRKSLSAMVTAMDDVVGRLVSALKEKGMYDNTLIIFTSDNGGFPAEGGSNHPLRGGKATIFEGGTRVPGFVHGPKSMLNPKKGHFTGLMHAVDWFKTITKVAGIDYNDPEQDGIDQWAAIKSEGKGDRNEVIYNLDFHPKPITGQAAIRIGDYKLIDGFPGILNHFYQPEGQKKKIDLWSVYKFRRNFNFPGLDRYDEHKYLFNLKEDPNEENNLYHKYSFIVAKLQMRLYEELANRYIPPNYPDGIEESNPDNYGGVWTPGWC